jgi:arginine decarboxylase
VGSKPELFIGMALQDQPGSLIICNGYKDPAFIKLALQGIKLGKKVIMVVEKLEELRQIITVSRQVGVEPLIGIRARLLSKGAGKWAESGGENAKFGLSTSRTARRHRNAPRGEARTLLQAPPLPHRLRRCPTSSP